MSVSVEQLFATLAAGDLCPREELEALRREATARGFDAPQCCENLVAAGRLTPYQGRRLAEEESPKLVLGDYAILDELGGGGMGRVYKAMHRRMDRVVALKVMAPDRIASAAALKRFHREVRAAARLIHPHIVTAFDAGEQSGTHYLVMEHVEGQDLATVVRENGVLPVIDALDCVLQVARGLHFAHSKGVIHRDIKPGNLLLDWSGHVRVLDMGLAALDRSLTKPAGERATSDAADEVHEPGELTQHGQIVGTLDYMAPEQAERAKNLDGRVDIYALGCTLFYLLVGRSPFAGETSEAKLRAHREEEIPSLVALRAEVPAEVDLLFCKMIAKRPDQRPANVGKLIGDLEECLAIARAQAAVAVVSHSRDAADEGSIGVASPRVEPVREEPTTVGEGHGITAEVPAATASPQPEPLVSALPEPVVSAEPVAELPASEPAVSPSIIAAETVTASPSRETESIATPAPLPAATVPVSIWIFAGVAIVALLAALGIALWPR